MKQKKKYLKWPFKKQKKQAIGMPSIQTNTDNPASYQQQTPPQPASQSEDTFHQTIQTLPYSVFVEILISKNLLLLIITGQPAQSKLEAAWSNILNEYSDAIKTEKSNNLFEAGKKLIYNRWCINFLSLALDYLKHEYDAAIAERISTLGYPLIEYNEDKNVYLKSIFEVETEAKFLIVQQNQLTAEYERLGGKKAPEQRQMIDYEKELRILSKFMGYNIRKQDITVMEYCSILNAYIENVEAIKKQTENG